jgi:hypothetical protein
MAPLRIPESHGVGATPYKDVSSEHGAEISIAVI